MLTVSGTFAPCVRSIDQDTHSIAAHLTLVLLGLPPCPPPCSHLALTLSLLLALIEWSQKTPDVPAVIPVL